MFGSLYAALQENDLKGVTKRQATMARLGMEGD